MEFNVEEFKEYYSKHQSKEVAVKYGIAPSTVAGRARKLNLPRKSHLYLNKNIEFTDFQKQVLIGSLLGDGSLNKTKTAKCHSHFEEGHCIKQLDWLNWKKEILKPLSRKITFKNIKGLKLIDGKLKYDETKIHKHCNLLTIKHPFLTDMERQWYKRDNSGNYIYRVENNKKYRIKIVPEFELTPLILAVWYIDDGSNDQKTKRLKFSTQGFQKEEIEILIEKIKKLGIHDCCIGEHTGFVIYIGTFSYLNLINLVKEQLPKLPEELRYKVDLSKYDESTKWTNNSTGVPFFRKKGKKYHGTVMINYKSIYLGSYDCDTANKVSQEIEYLVRHRCKDPNKFLEIKNKYT
jgi:hypothetical protein